MFRAPKLTSAGKALYYENMAGERLTFTTIKMGSGTLSEPIANLTDLVKTVVTIPAAVSVNDGYMNVAGAFSNADLTEGFYWREIGVFVANPDDPTNRTEDILYCYQNAYDTADYIPVASVETVEKNITVPMIVGDAASVSCTLSKSQIYITVQDLENHNSNKTAHSDIRQTADNAASAATTAQQTADNATSAAATAQQTADNATSAAATAQQTADNAASAAATAQQTADNATSAAATAQQTADNAASAAATAQQTADNAASAAATAQQTADNALQKAEDNVGGCVLQITFDSAFSGKTYAVTGPADESYTGTVPTGLYVEVNVKNTNTTYTVSSTDSSNVKYSETVTTGAYFGQYPVQLTTFSATLNVTTSAGATVTATSGGNTYTETADSGGVASLTIRHSGTYEVTSALNGETVSGSIAITTSGGTYALTLAFISTTLNKNTWAKIKEVSDAGTGSNYWSVGDTKTIAINGTVGNTTFSNLSIDVFILGFNHNSAREGSNRIHFQIGKISGTPVALVDSNYGNSGSSSANFQMNASNTNSGGWNASSMRKTLLGNNGTPSSPPSGSLLAALPADLRAVMKSCTKYSDNNGGGSDAASYVTSTADYLFLLSEFEYHGARSYANSAEQNYQAQYAYYQAGNSKIKRKHNDTGTAAYAWCRSVYASYSYTFCLVNTDGNAHYNGASSSYSIAPGFCA